MIGFGGLIIVPLPPPFRENVITATLTFGLFLLSRRLDDGRRGIPVEVGQSGAVRREPLPARRVRVEGVSDYYNYALLAII